MGLWWAVSCRNRGQPGPRFPKRRTRSPMLIYTGAPASMTSIDEFYALQHIIPAQIVIPLSLDIVFIVLVVVCIVALGMMTRVVLSPSMSQVLRLNED